ncbi:MAG TPA: hypothetical protein VIN93_12075 [Bryobacteraceae bacterium]|jgi:hypothetical protein
MATENTISGVGLNALRDMVELQMYLVAQAPNKPWPMHPRSTKGQRKARKPYRNPIEASAVAELLDQGLLEATSNRTFVVSKYGHQVYEREMKRISA